MMDAHDTNQPLNQGELEEEKKTVEVSEAITETPAEDVTAEVQPEAAPKPATKEDVLNQLKELAQDAENANKQEIDNLKQSFYKLHNAELEAAKVQFTDNGGNIEDFVAPDGGYQGKTQQTGCRVGTPEGRKPASETFHY